MSLVAQSYGGIKQRVRTYGTCRIVNVRKMGVQEAKAKVLNQLKSAKQDKCMCKTKKKKKITNILLM